MQFSSILIEAMQSNPELYKKTAFIQNYDEGGQFFDHHWVPTPPVSDLDGKSTVTVEGEVTKTDYEGIVLQGNPIGLGIIKKKNYLFNFFNNKKKVLEFH